MTFITSEILYRTDGFRNHYYKEGVLNLSEDFTSHVQFNTSTYKCWEQANLEVDDYRNK